MPPNSSIRRFRPRRRAGHQQGHQDHPYYLTKVQVKQAIEMMKRNPDYADIQQLETERGKVPYLFAEGVMSHRYAQALADAAETDEADR